MTLNLSAGRPVTCLPNIILSHTNYAMHAHNNLAMIENIPSNLASAILKLADLSCLIGLAVPNQ